MHHWVGLRRDDAVDRWVHAAGHLGKIRTVCESPRPTGAKHQRLARRQFQVLPVAELPFFSTPQIDKDNIGIGGEFQMARGKRGRKWVRGSIEHGDGLFAAGQRLHQDVHIARVIGEHGLVPGGILVQGDDLFVAQYFHQFGCRSPQIVADDERRIEHRPKAEMRTRLSQVPGIEIARADIQHVRIVPRTWMRVERPADRGIHVVEHSPPDGKDVFAGT